MALTPEDVVNQKFTITKFRDGYDLDQVDDFLDTIVEELRQFEEEKAALRAQIDELTAKLEACESGAQSAPAASEQTIVVDAPAPAPAPAAPVTVAAVAGGSQPDAVKSSAMLQLALELHDKHVHEGETTRDQLISEAESKRDQMIKDAERTAKQLVEEAQQQRADELRELGEERGDLQFKIKDLRQFESEYRSTLRSYIQSQLRGLDGSPEPAGAPDGLQ
ncbi:DivIVA domain-containing protein [Leucobacter luti]|uniref:Cell wall synthesis protein Wag31 n=1 Tax=Leucobacter luti TaxID=340320 RepID=A0A4R6RZT7_9MICO|nr:DivIVA domain-containing protein [Leucobacter luti]MCW2287581.1 DivIVA domain-containing protein [Leucobacter luti]QYM76387.1 DivIVA domain-containing protein [Leucobacter luti]TCK46251.1 DivIVA domain-containing protein [Leucobacter luti]TDP92680.1 DivIVA domain-containing protein [Leucobacter luti]